MPKMTNTASEKNPTIYTKQYRQFRGVDFSQSEAMVDDSRSPRSVNIISDTGGFPEKRVGWRTLKTLPGAINGIYYFDGETPDGTEVSCFIVHAGSEIYRLDSDDSEPVLLISDIADRKSRAGYFKGLLCILTGSEYLVFDGEKCYRAEEHDGIYAPTTIVTRETMGIKSTMYRDDSGYNNFKAYGSWKDSDGNNVSPGIFPEGSGVNLLTRRRKNSFCADTADTSNKSFMFILDGIAEENSRLIMRYKPTGEVLFDVVLKDDGTKNITYNNKLSGTMEGDIINTDLLDRFYTYNSSGSGAAISVYLNVGRASSTYVLCEPNDSKIPNYSFTPGVDNFEIEYSKAGEVHSDRINKCTILDVYENRVFFSGNPDFPNADFASGVNDPTYIPDTNYTEIGVDSSAIAGYLRTGDSQAILKEDGEDATIYMRTMTFDSDGNALFPIKQGISGLGATSPHAICTFLDDPVYLTRNGIYAIAQQDISSERALNLRSTRVNRKLLKNKDLSGAIMTSWNGYLILCVENECYVADAAQKSYSANKTGTFEYEWYYWTNIPARVFCEHKGELYFGTADGRICKFNSDMINSRGEVESAAYSDDGEAIVAEWATNLSDDGDFMRKKTMVKTGSGVFLKTYDRSSVKVFVRTDTEFEREILEKTDEVSDSSYMHSGDLEIARAPYSIVPFNTRVKKYSAIQIICRNDKVNHAFGVQSIIRRFFIGNRKK